MTGSERRVIALLGLTIALGPGCGGTASPTVASTPSVAAAPTPTPTPSPSTTPVPAPTPTPCTLGLCEPPTTNTSRPVRLTLRLYAVEDGEGKFIEDFPANQDIPTGYTARIDVTAKDEDDADTNG